VVICDNNDNGNINNDSIIIVMILMCVGVMIMWSNIININNIEE